MSRSLVNSPCYVVEIDTVLKINVKCSLDFELANPLHTVATVASYGVPIASTKGNTKLNSWLNMYSSQCNPMIIKLLLSQLLTIDTSSIQFRIWSMLLYCSYYWHSMHYNGIIGHVITPRSEDLSDQLLFLWNAPNHYSDSNLWQTNCLFYSASKKKQPRLHITGRVTLKGPLMFKTIAMSSHHHAVSSSVTLILTWFNFNPSMDK